MTDAGALLPDCGCCDEPQALTPMPTANRAGLSSIAVRAGTHWSFKTTMLSDLTRRLPKLTTREDDDSSIALVDSWAAVLDVLTFYQERIANEGYLRTATETQSVYELAREIGYQPSPGVAASTALAFDLESATGSPESVQIPAGTKVQSVPGPNEMPQTFETIEAIEARPQWNQLRPQQSVRRVPRIREREAWLDGLSTGLKPGDAVLFVGPEREGDAGSEQWDLRLVSSVEADSDRRISRITWSRGLGWKGGSQYVEPAGPQMRCYALRQRAALFGHNAPDWRSMPLTLRREHGDASSPPTLKDWPGLSISQIAAMDPSPPESGRTIFLDTVYSKVTPGSWIVLQASTLTKLYRADPELGPQAVAEDSRTRFTLTAKTTRITLEGANLGSFEQKVRQTVVFVQSEELAFAATPVVEPIQGVSILLDAPVEGLQKGHRLLVVGPPPRVKVPDGSKAELKTASGSMTLHPRDRLVVTKPFIQLSSGKRVWTVMTELGVEGQVISDETDPSLVPLPADATDPLVVEEVLVDRLEDSGDPDHPRVVLTQPLLNVFDRFATTVAANVARATHGETRNDILGSGDGSKPFQSFSLSKSPLTYVPAATPTGGVSTLKVEVNEMAWEQAPSLFGRGPRDRAFAVRIGDEGETSITFGDGSSGARLPTGRENVTATYRFGVGKQGNLKASQLSLLLTRPLGVKKVTNPMASTGGADPENRDEARVNAPSTVLTFERVVSLADYEDFARAFGGIAKARAAWVWKGIGRAVHLTVAGVDGAAVPSDSLLAVNLAAAIRSSGDPNQPLLLDSYDPRTFDLNAGVFVKEGRDWDRVKSDVVAAVRAAFSFSARDLAQEVTLSEVVAVIQSVSGVLAVDLGPGGLRPTGGSPSTSGVLQSQPAYGEADNVAPAQLLMINPNAGGVTVGRRP